MRVKKYNKSHQDFNKGKIAESIKIAAKAVNEDIPDFIANRIALSIEDELLSQNTKSISAEDISELVETKLMQSSYKHTAWSYITYHYDRQKEHLYNSDLIKAFQKKLSGMTIENSNANSDEKSFSGKMNEAARVLLKDDALNLMSKTSKNNHLNNEVYTHDLDSFSVGQHNCFDRSTKFITKDGIKAFTQFVNGSEVTVLAKDGIWRQATVKSYGVKSLQDVVLEYVTPNNTDTITIGCTNNHRWYLKDGSVTEKLKVGDELINLPTINDVDICNLLNSDFKTKFTDRQANENTYWTVKSITKRCHINNTVWCIEEPITTGFVLEGGIVTGNCLSIPFDQLLESGIAIKQTDIRQPRSISTAFQLIAVFIQVQSLQQFGGVSATHLDWTLVPYVRWSFVKHYRDGLKYIKGKDNWTIPTNSDELPIASFLNNPEDPDNIVYKYALDMTNRDTKQGAEGLIHNLNSLQSRSGQQLPFSSINFGTCTLDEGRMVINAILDAELDGTGPLHKTPIFPCSIFQYDEKINGKPNTPNYDLFRKALECTSKRLYPNYCNCSWSTNIAGINKDIENKRKLISKLSTSNMETLVRWCNEHQKEAAKFRMVVSDNKVVIDENMIIPTEISSTMGCRTNNSYDLNFDFSKILNMIIKGKKYETQLYSGNQKDGRGNICPATIILPTIAMQTRGKLGQKSTEDFINKLSVKIDECRDQLIDRFILIAKQSPLSATFMYYNNTMAGYKPEEGILSALKHGTLAIGQLGLAECLQILIGTDHTTDAGMKLAKQIEQLFKDKVDEYKKTTYNILDQTIYLNFGVYYTPAENLCFTACSKFKEKYGEIPNISDKKFFTNSMHVPVWHDITPFEKIDIESQLTGYSSAGCITYVELDSAASHNIDALETVVVYAMEKDVPYLGLNLPNDSCMECGWTGEINDKCPACHSSEIKRLRRVTGYITSDYTSTFNEGKVDEVNHRVKHVGVIKNI